MNVEGKDERKHFRQQLKYNVETFRSMRFFRKCRICLKIYLFGSKKMCQISPLQCAKKGFLEISNYFVQLQSRVE